MKTIQLCIIIAFLSVAGFSQNGINYKATITDGSGAILSNDLIVVQFTILENATTLYQENHTPTTDGNGLVVINIGDGTPLSGSFSDIDWTTKNHFLNVQVDTGGGLQDLGTTAFASVPYAAHAQVASNALNVSGLEQIDEGNGPGWRLMGADSETHGNIGLNAVDLTTNLTLGDFGATGQNSVAFGTRTSASGGASVAFGVESIASANNSAAFGQSTTASAFASTAIGQSTLASGQYSTAMGINTMAESYGSFAIGRYNLGGGNPSEWIDGNPLFEIGNGTSNANRSNALTVSKDGTHTISSSQFGLLVTESTVGLFILNPSDDGIIVSSAADYGALIGGATAGVYASCSIDTNPDIIIAGNDGIIATEDTNSTDMFLRSNDAVVVQLDYDNDEGGNFRIRNGTGNNVFDVSESGTVRVNNSVVHNSDKRLKKDIEDLSYGLNEILQLQPKQYFWKNQEQDKKSLGLIAQEVQPIIKEIVTTQEDEIQTLGVSYTELIPVLINAIKEQQAIIEKQGEALKASNSNYEALLSRIENLESNTSN